MNKITHKINLDLRTQFAGPAAIATALILPLTLSAQVRTWDAGGNASDWTDAANWTSDDIPDRQ